MVRKNACSIDVMRKIVSGISGSHCLPSRAFDTQSSSTWNCCMRTSACADVIAYSQGSGYGVIENLGARKQLENIVYAKLNQNVRPLLQQPSGNSDKTHPPI